MLHRLYNPWHITNSGEREADRQFRLIEGMETMPVYILYQLRLSSRFLEKNMAGECDFVVIAPAGYHGCISGSGPFHFRIG